MSPSQQFFFGGIPKKLIDTKINIIVTLENLYVHCVPQCEISQDHFVMWYRNGVKDTYRIEFPLVSLNLV